MFKRLWKQLRSDWIRVIMALIIASLIYILRSGIFSSAIEIKTLNNIPVNINYSSANIINLDNNKHTLSVTLEGGKHRINNISADDITVNVVIDHSHFEDGVINLSEKNIQCPMGVKIKDFHPAHITVNPDYIESKKVPVISKFDPEKKLSENYSVAKTTLVPSEVMISGPRSLIKDITSVDTEFIPLDSSIQNNFKYDVNIAQLKGVNTAPSKVNCEVFITRNFTNRTLKKVPVSLLLGTNSKKNLKFKLSPQVVEVDVSGPSRIIPFLTVNDFELFVNVSEISKPGEYILNIHGTPRSKEVKILSLTPLQLTVTVQAQ